MDFEEMCHKIAAKKFVQASNGCDLELEESKDAYILC